MHVTMIKKRLENGEPCQKCAQAEELLAAAACGTHRRGVVADVRDPSSTGYQLAVQHGLDLAPFFIVKRGDESLGTPAS